MGFGKTTLIGVVVIVGFFMIWSLASMASTASEEAKYEGLTEEQIDAVKIVKERCESSAFMAGAGSDTATQRYMEECEEMEARLIADL